MLCFGPCYIPQRWTLDQVAIIRLFNSLLFRLNSVEPLWIFGHGVKQVLVSALFYCPCLSTHTMLLSKSQDSAYLASGLLQLTFTVTLIRRLLPCLWILSCSLENCLKKDEVVPDVCDLLKLNRHKCVSKPAEIKHSSPRRTDQNDWEGGQVRLFKVVSNNLGKIPMCWAPDTAESLTTQCWINGIGWMAYICSKCL